MPNIDANIDTAILLENTNNNQRIAANPEKSIWASANAGAGKTKVLIDRIARLLLSGSDPSMILAVTYTKAAAAEMTTRLFNTLGDWSVTDDATLSKRLNDLDPNLRLDGEILSRARRLFARALETPGGLKIETIHAFCGNILKRFPLEAGIAQGFEVIEESESDNLRALALSNGAHIDAETFMEIKSILSRDNIIPSLENATKYMGNDDVANIATRLKDFLGIDKIISPQDAMNNALSCLDFGLMKECAQIMAGGSTTEQKGSVAIFDILQSDDRFTAIIDNLIITTSGSIRKKPPITKALSTNPAIVKFFGDGQIFPDGQLGGFWALAQEVQKLKIYHDTLNLLKAAKIYSNEYSTLKTRAAKLDFSDLLQKTSNLLNRDEGSALWVLYKLDQGLSHVLIDESQDTSAEQWDLLTPLLNALESGERNYARTRFVVGDDKQSIYSFQGASPERYLEEREKFKLAGQIDGVEFRDVDFNMSFRTGQTILDAVDRVWMHVNDIKGNEELETKYAKTRHYSARANQNGKVEIWPVEMGRDKDTEDAAWEHPVDAILESSPVNQLADQIALEIKGRIEDKELIFINQDTARPIEARDIMILVKTRKALFHQIIKRLKHYNIPVAGSDLIIIKEDPAILDLIALGRFVLRPEDDFNLACVLKSVFCNLYNDDAHLFPLAYGRGFDSLWKRLTSAEDVIYNDAKSFLLEILKIGPSLTPFKFFAFILERQLPNGKTGWENMIARLGRESKEAVDVLLDLALKADSMGCGNLLAFLDMVEYQSGTQKREFDEHSEGVKVMTVHGAKGREAPIVILPDTTRAINSRNGSILFEPNNKIPIFVTDKFLDLDILDAIKEGDKLKAKAEDNRLLYVAMTRARDNLILCGHKFRNNYDGKSWYAEFENSILQDEDLEDLILRTNDEEKIAKIIGNAPKNVKIQEVQNEIAEQIIIPDWAISEPKPFDPPPKLIAPSGLIDEDNEPPVISPLLGGTKSRYLRGQLIHNLLELLPQIEDNLKTEWANKWGKARIKDEALRNDVVFEALKIINDENYKELFGKNSRAEVAIVGKGKNLDTNIIINGTIDRLIIKNDEIIILDYKTNRPPPTDANKIPKVYINQMAAYRAVLQNQFPKHHIKCALLWTDIPLLMEIEGKVLDDAVTKIRQI